jgi:hypothetical protein
MSLRWLFIFPRHEKSRQSVWFCSYFLGGWEGRQDHGVIEPVTLCFFLPSSYHSLCSLPPEFGSKAKQFPEIWIGCSKHKNRRSDFCVGYCTSQSTSPLQNPTYQNGKGGNLLWLNYAHGDYLDKELEYVGCKNLPHRTATTRAWTINLSKNEIN